MGPAGLPVQFRTTDEEFQKGIKQLPKSAAVLKRLAPPGYPPGYCRVIMNARIWNPSKFTVTVCVNAQKFWLIVKSVWGWNLWDHVH